MLDVKLVREQADSVKAGAVAKGLKPELVDEVKKLDETRRQLLVQVETLRAHRNILTADQKDEGKQIKTQLKTLEDSLAKVTTEFDTKFSALPNLPSVDTPIGKSDKDNVEIRKWGTPKQFGFSAKDHLQLGKDLDILDFDTGAKVTGSQFYYLYNEGALLELALTQYGLNFLKKRGFTPVITPDLAKSYYYLGTGYAPRGDEAQTYTIEGHDLGLIATAEVTLAGKHADEVIPASKLPLKYAGYSHCFRQEAGAYGKYSKGLYRVHQFTKVEMFIYCLPEDSAKHHQEILSLEETICQELGLPYRVVQMCSADLGAMAAAKYDLEAWMPGRGDYGEVTSTSNCTDYQARNLNIRYKSADSSGFVHMLNGTAIVMSRFPLAILENYQNRDGSVTIPEVLRPYTGFDRISPRR